MARIGIYGGTFNPIHNTHIEIAKAAKTQFSLDKVIFLVAGEPPHKKTADELNPFCRLEMVELAIRDFGAFEIDMREIVRAGKSYSYLTLTEYAMEYPNDELFFILGSDSLLKFSDWVKPEIISSKATILCAPRTGDNLEEIRTCISSYNETYPGDFDLIDYMPNDVSSTKIREAIEKNAFSDNIDALVFDYIIDHHLYGKTYDYDIVMEMSSEMKEELKTSRYVHTQGVANIAYALALKWNYPAYNAMLAGMLHDCAKCLSDEKRLDICRTNDIYVSEIEEKYPHLLHGKVGAHLAEKKYKIKDEQIKHAIAVHTTGCVNMNLLDKIIFVADYIEPGRDKQPRLDTLRSIAFDDLDLCVFMILEDTITYLEDSKDSMDPTTIETYNFYKKLRGI